MKSFLFMGALSVLLLFAPHVDASIVAATPVCNEEVRHLNGFVRYWTQFDIEGGYRTGKQWHNLNYSSAKKLDCFSNLFLYLSLKQIDRVTASMSKTSDPAKKIEVFFNQIIESLGNGRDIMEYIRLAKLNPEVAQNYAPKNLGLKLSHERHCSYFYLDEQAQTTLTSICNEMLDSVKTSYHTSTLRDFLQDRINELAQLPLVEEHDVHVCPSENEHSGRSSVTSESDEHVVSKYLTQFERMYPCQRKDIYDSLVEVSSMLNEETGQLQASFYTDGKTAPPADGFKIINYGGRIIKVCSSALPRS